MTTKRVCSCPADLSWGDLPGDKESMGEEKDLSTRESKIAKIAYPPIRIEKTPSKVSLAASDQVSPLDTMWDELNRRTSELSFSFLDKKEAWHRFENIPCPRETAVMVRGTRLHANIVGEGISKRNFVASQAPLCFDFEHFWQALFDNNGSIIDLTTPEDEKKGASPYYPTSIGEAITFGSMTMTLARIEGNVFTYQVMDGALRQVKTVKRCHYDTWKDFSAVSVHDLYRLVQLLRTTFGEAWTLIHCRAGVGRTGTLIAAAILQEKILDGSVTLENLLSSMVEVVIILRKQRGPNVVQEKRQFELLEKFCLFCLENQRPPTIQDEGDAAASALAGLTIEEASDSPPPPSSCCVCS